MADQDDTALPAGISIAVDRHACVRYTGTETAFLAAGWLRPEWIEGLGPHTRSIAVTKGGGFLIVGEGQGMHLTHAHRSGGAITVKRLPNGKMFVGKWRTMEEEKALDAARDARWEERRQQAAWNRAKVARGECDFLEDWKANVTRKIEEVGELAEGKRIFANFPEIRLSADALKRVNDAMVQLVAAITEATPLPTDIERAGNVITLRPSAYRHMEATAGSSELIKEGVTRGAK